VIGFLLAASPSLATAAELKCPRGAKHQGKAPPEARKEWCSRPDGTQHGPSVSYYESGEPMARAVFADGEMHGLYQAWHPNGQLAETGNYVRDQRDGAFKTYTPEGGPLTEETFKNGKQHGVARIWFDNGQLMVEAMYANGDRHGPAVTYYEDGRKRSQGVFKNGAYDGTWEGWYPDGSVEKVAEFDEGRELSRKNYPPPSGGGD
jgi:antitoxin component YwqK of YwqJK toxin-antitoxin module